MTGRGKLFIVVAAMLTTFTLMPVLSAAAAEPLADGSYDVPVAGDVHTVVVADGLPTVDAPADVVFRFSFDVESGRVLDRFGVVADGIAYEAEVIDDGTVVVVLDPDAPVLLVDPTPGASTGTEPSGGATDDATAAPQPAPDADPVTTAPTPSVDPTDDADDAYGELVSLVAGCAPRGAVARHAGLPSHGALVSAAARGAAVDLVLDGRTVTIELTSTVAAQQLCDVTASIVAAAQALDEVVERGDAPVDPPGRAPSPRDEEPDDEPDLTDAVDSVTSDTADLDVVTGGVGDAEELTAKGNDKGSRGGAGGKALGGAKDR